MSNDNLYTPNFSLLYSYFILHLMRKKQPVHPKFHVKEELIKSSNKMYQYLSNDFIDSERVIKEEVEIKN